MFVRGMFFVLGGEAAKLPEDGEAEEDEQTDGAALREVLPSRHSLYYR